MPPLVRKNTKAIVATVAENAAQHFSSGQLPDTLEGAVGSIVQSLVVGFLVWFLPNSKSGE